MTLDFHDRGALSPKLAAEWLSCSRDTIDRLIRAGSLHSFKIGKNRYISTKELARFVEDRELNSGKRG